MIIRTELSTISIYIVVLVKDLIDRFEVQQPSKVVRSKKCLLYYCVVGPINAFTSINIIG